MGGAWNRVEGSTMGGNPLANVARVRGIAAREIGRSSAEGGGTFLNAILS